VVDLLFKQMFARKLLGNMVQFVTMAAAWSWTSNNCTACSSELVCKTGILSIHKSS